MLDFFKKILLLTAVVAVLFTTSGFPVYYHHCSDSDIAETSLLIKNFSCSHLNDHNDQCGSESREQSGCCQPFETMPDREEDSSEEDCCTTTRNFIKITIDLKYDHFKPTIQLYSTLLSFVRIVENSVNTENFTGFLKIEAPPPKPAKSLLISLHQLKLDTLKT